MLQLRPARVRRPSLTASISIGAAVGVLATAWFAITPTTVAAAAVTPVTAITAISTGAGNPAADTFNSITSDTRGALARAQIALAVAESTTGRASASGLDLGTDGSAVDTTDLRAAIDDLDGFDVMPILLVPDLTKRVVTETEAISSRIAALNDRLDAAFEKKAAERAAAEAAAEAQRQAEAAAAAAAALAAANTPEGAKATAAQIASSQYGWGSGQFSCLASLWQKESGWNYQAYNASSGATGIPQALPGSKMASAGTDWQTNAATQIRWGLDYIARAYGTPCAAWGHSQATNWY